MASFGINRRHHPILRDPLGDAPRSLASVGIRLDVLASDQRQQGDDLRLVIVNTPVCATTWRTASKIRCGAAEERSLLRDNVGTVGWNPSLPNASPAATFQR